MGGGGRKLRDLRIEFSWNRILEKVFVTPQFCAGIWIVASYGFISDVIAVGFGELEDQFGYSTGPVGEKADYMDLVPCSGRADQALS